MKLRKIKHLIFLLLMIFVPVTNIFSQGATTQGKDFWVSFGMNGNNPSSALDMQIRIATIKACRVTLSFTESSVPSVSFDIPANGVYTYQLSEPERSAASTIDDANKIGIKGVSDRSLHITSTEAVSVYALNQLYASTDATNVLPVDNWGTDYYHIGYNSMEMPLSGGYIVIAKENGTTVYEDGKKLATLNRGQTYSTYESLDITGKHITSDKSVAYFVSVASTYIPSRRGSADCLYQQLPPVNQWGNRFMVPNTVQGRGRIRVMACYNNTTFSVSSATIITGKKTLNAGEFAELEISNNNGCYITSDKPTGVCAYMVGGTSSYMVDGRRGDPAETWVPPVDQMMNDVLVAPFMTKGNTQLVRHYALIITRTAEKNNTTASIDNALPVNISKEITWTDNVGISGYSFGSYLMNRNVSYLFDNPDKLLVMGCGTGSSESYYYLAGSAARNLLTSFTVNGESSQDMEGKTYCETNGFVFDAGFGSGFVPASITWRLNQQELTAYRNRKTAYANGLADGIYTISMTATPSEAGGSAQTVETYFLVGRKSVIWTPEANTSGSDAQKQDWNIAENWTPAGVPQACYNIYIPGNSTHYPQLTKEAACRNIYFMQGGEIGRPDLLTYDKASVHLNLGLRQFIQQKERDGEARQNLVLSSDKTSDRLKFSASTSTPLERERWYALSAPLRSIVSGDLNFGGSPLTFMKKFGPVVKDNTNYPVGDWTTPYNRMDEKFQPADGFGFYMYGYRNSSGDDTGCMEIGFFDDLNDLTYLPASVTGHEYGIWKTNGILELPFFADSLNIEAHRTQVFDTTTRQSTFYYIFSTANRNELTGDKETVVRDNNDGNYRFIAEEYAGNAWKFQNPLYHTTTGLNSGDEFMAGNPYMSSIDMVEFCRDNVSSLDPEFRIWNGTTFETFSVDIANGSVTPTVPVNSRYVAPLQGFFLTYKSGDVKFDVTKISKVRPAKTASNLRSSSEEAEENILRIKAENGKAVSYTLIGHREGASAGFIRGEDVRKLFSLYDYVPEIYSLAGDIPADINYINHAKEVTIPLGVRTQELGTVTLTFTGMDHYRQASKIVFIDMLLNKEMDLSGKSIFTYSFENQSQGIQNGRFLISFQPSFTSITLPPVNADEEIHIYSGISGIAVKASSSDPIRQIQVFDMQGKKLYDRTFSDAVYSMIPDKFNTRQVILQVITKNKVKKMKTLLTSKSN